ncbi:MAG: SWIM zinc finger family protein [Candidatus Vogelbacteria bacterium]|nr:SWIM zinc finger family protein [Candidatus Vogelbacteria bacterium]
MQKPTTLSASQLLLSYAYEETWYRGEEYADKKLARLQKYDTKSVQAKVSGTKSYEVLLRFAGSSVSRECSCPYVGGDVCKHMVAVAIIWDEKRGLSRPTHEMVAGETITPPFISMTQITSAYKNPLTCDLEIVRMSASERAAESRAHLRLPLRPPFLNDSEKAVSLSETKRAFREISRWTMREGYDQYYCGGEVVAAFCEVLRSVLRREKSSQPKIIADVLIEAQNFHETLLNDLVDVRDGIEIFGSAHMNELYQLLDREIKKMNSADQIYVEKQLAVFDDRADLI